MATKSLGTMSPNLLQPPELCALPFRNGQNLTNTPPVAGVILCPDHSSRVSEFHSHQMHFQSIRENERRSRGITHGFSPPVARTIKNLPAM